MKRRDKEIRKQPAEIPESRRYNKIPGFSRVLGYPLGSFIHPGYLTSTVTSEHRAVKMQFTGYMSKYTIYWVGEILKGTHDTVGLLQNGRIQKCTEGALAKSGIFGFVFVLGSCVAVLNYETF